MTDTIKNWHTAHRESLTRGQRAADVMLLEINNRQVRMLRDLQQLLDRQHPTGGSVQES